MKIFAYLSAFSAANALQCFTCRANSAAECLATGKVQQCLANEEVCQVHQRKRNGVVYRVRMECKEHRACDNNYRFNFIKGPAEKHLDDQCKPNEPNSVCRQCCDFTPDCGINLVLQNGGQGPDRNGWNADIAKHELPPLPTGGTGGKHHGWNRRHMFKKLGPHDFDPNDSRYTGTLTDFISDPNDSRFDKLDPRHKDVDYAGPPKPSKLGWW